jgi:cytochrome c oxidase subunit 4
MSEHVLPFRVYVFVWIALMALMALTVYLSTVPMGHALNTAVALFIAAVKAVLVLMFFMHLKYESY